MYDDILLPTDGSRGMAKAIEQCLFLAEQNDATVHVLYVVDLRAYVMLPEETQASVVAVLEEEAADAVEVVERLAEGLEIPVVPVVERGVPHEAILSYAEGNDIDLVVMGTHGRTGEAQRAIGSVAEQVVRSAQMPVLTVRMSEEASPDFLEALPEEARPRYIE